jgi:hypothetical protein
MMAIIVLVSLVCTFLLPETMGTTLKDSDTHTGRWGAVRWARKARCYAVRPQEVATRAVKLNS